MAERDLEGRLETIANRIDFIELLEEAGPLEPRDIVDALPHSRATVTRALKELRDADLVERGGSGYVATVTGVVAADEYRRYRTASEAVLSAEELLRPLPIEHALPPRVLVGADTILAEGHIPIRALEAVSDRVQRADRIRVYLPTLVNTHLLRVWHRTVLASAVESTAVFDPNLLTVLKGQYPHLLAEMASSSGFEAYTLDGPPYGLVCTTADGQDAVAVIVYETEAGVRGVLTNDAPEATEWATQTFETLRRDATDVTGELESLSDAVADGVVASARTVPNAADTDTQGHPLPVELETAGFVRLSTEYFDSHDRAEPAVSWRTGFTLPEVYDGHPVRRRTDAGESLTVTVLESLRSGENQVLLGPPGSGKSTACMAVACEWYRRDLGPVLYRERGSGDRFDTPALLEAYLRECDGQALVVVEDAIRDEANSILKTMRSLDADPSVSFLLDSRTEEWTNGQTVESDPRLEAYRRSEIEPVEMPGLDESECERFVEHFMDILNAEATMSGADLFEAVQTGRRDPDEDGGAGDALIAQAHLVGRYDLPMSADASLPTALETAVERTYSDLVGDETPYVVDLAVLVALLTASGIPVAREYCYAIADEGELASIDRALTRLEGELLFAPNRTTGGRPATYRTRHEMWATTFLSRLLANEGTASARERVGTVLSRLFALADDSARREEIDELCGGQAPHLHRIAANPRGWADEIIERCFTVGVTDATLAPLYGETGETAIELPQTCSGWTRLREAYWRGEMARHHGDLVWAEREYQRLGELAEGTSLEGEPVPPEFARESRDIEETRVAWRATCRARLGTVARERGEYDRASTHHREALELFRRIEDHAGVALTLKNLGIVAFYQSEYEEARRFYRRGLAIADRYNHPGIQAECLNNLGGVAWRQGKYEDARTYLEESLEIGRDLGDEKAEYSILNNLGDIAQAQDKYEDAQSYYERSLSIFRDRGDRPAQAKILTNLGQVAYRRGLYAEAREFLERSLSIKRDLEDRAGEALTLRNLGQVARARGDFDRAERLLNDSRELSQELEDRQGVAACFVELGILDATRGDLEGGSEHADRGLQLAKELEAQSIVARAHLVLAGVAMDEDRRIVAEAHLQEAADIFNATASTFGDARCRYMAARLALARSDRSTALEEVERALGSFERIGATHWIARSKQLRGRILARDDREASATNLRDAAETFESIGAPYDGLRAIRTLVELESDESERRTWLARADAILQDAPDATVQHHRDWVEQHKAQG